MTPVSRVIRSTYGTMPDGSAVEAIDLATPRGLRMRVLTYGAIIASLEVPDREGILADVVLGHDTLEGYLTASPYFGAAIGRCANRIAWGRFTLDGVEHVLATNDGDNHLHGGARGFDQVLWTVEDSRDASAAMVVLGHVSADGEEGYPGRLEARVTYTLSDDEGLAIEYEATTDRPTIVNLTQHSYWNLGGPEMSTILGHRLRIDADRFTPVDAGLIPTGELRPVEGSPFDFRRSTEVGRRIAADDEQLVRARGYDHNFLLGPAAPDGMRTAATLSEPASGRVLEVRTTEPGLQLYSGNFLDGSIRGKGGRVYGHRAALCLETQHFPDSPNQLAFPSVILRPGETYRSRTVYAFGID